MGVVNLDPTVFADNLVALQDEAEYTQVVLTGICNVSKVELYSAIIEGLDSLGRRYGAMISDTSVMMASTDVEDYLEELIATIMDTTGIQEIDLMPTGPVDDDEESVTDRIYFTDEYEDFQKCNGDQDIVSAYDLLLDFVNFAFKCSIKVLTGEIPDIACNKFVV